jgi:ComF family protein
MLHVFRQLGRSLAELAFPPSCLLCRAAVDDPRIDFCRHCNSMLNQERSEPACARCACSIGRDEIGRTRCADCIGRSLRVDGTVRVATYHGAIGWMLRAYKYDGRMELAETLSEYLYEVVASTPWRSRIEAVVPVPTHWRRRLLRQSDYPAEVLSRAVASRIDLPLMSLLFRRHQRAHQVGLAYSQRFLNVHDAFGVRRGVRLVRSRILLIDDVRTSGATLDECARMLRKAGAAEVYAAVVARVADAHAGSPRLATA